MSGLIKISDLRFNGRIELLAFDLVDLLAPILVEGQCLKWSIMGNLDVLGEKSYPPKHLREQLKSKKNLTSKGILLSWEELLIYANSVIQISDGSFVGCKNTDSLPSDSVHQVPAFINPDNELYKACEIVLEAYESTFWMLYASDDTVIERYRQKFHNIEVVKLW